MNSPDSDGEKLRGPNRVITYRTLHDWTGPRTVSDSIVAAVMTATSHDLEELDLLYSVVEPDAMDRLFQAVPTGPDRLEGTVAFPFNDCDVTVSASGRITVRIAERETGTHRNG